MGVMRWVCAIVVCGAASLASGGPLDADTRREGRAIVDRAIAFLASEQNPETGAWDAAFPGAALPAVTGLVVDGLLMDPRYDADDPMVARGIDAILSHVNADGSIHDGMLPSYNTAICLSALSRARTATADSVLRDGVRFLRSVQYHEASTGGAEAPTFTEPVGAEHPYYGGVGYGKHGRPDLSNLGFFLQALHDAGVSSEDPAIKRAQVFLSRVQMLDETNDMGYADGSTQGGFIYATVPNLESVDGRAGQSQAGDIVERTPQGGELTRLRAYGSMTYVGFKSLIYADLDPDDPRVEAALRWMDAHYTLDENPGMGDQGYYYYLSALARALRASGHTEIGGVDWRVDLIGTLGSLQNPDGSFGVRHDRWMESDTTLTAAYALIALQCALD